MQHVKAVYLARRVVPVDPQAVQWLLGVELSFWAKQTHKQHAVVDRLAAIEWPVGLVIVSLTGGFAAFEAKFQALGDARVA